jgi:hypothetical protein
MIHPQLWLHCSCVDRQIQANTGKNKFSEVSTMTSTPYVTPVLTEYGNLMELTQSAGAGSFCDNGGSGYWNYSG